MEQLFSTAQIAADLEHKSQNPRRDVFSIAKRLGFTPVLEQTRDGYQGGRKAKLWSREQRDAILADNRNRHKEPAQMDEHNPDITNVAITARAFIAKTDDLHTLKVLRDSLAETLALLDDKINDLAEKILP